MLTKMAKEKMVYRIIDGKEKDEDLRKCRQVMQDRYTDDLKLIEYTTDYAEDDVRYCILRGDNVFIFGNPFGLSDQKTKDDLISNCKMMGKGMDIFK